jgi:DNA-directed RNA polymerase subunit RPC12/RpoP
MRSDQLELIDRSLEQQAIEQERDDVDNARRAEYLERLRAALPELRRIEGFPIGSDEDILALSDPPYYTACPNPFLAEFISEHSTPYAEEHDDYHREPFAADVSEGKNDPIYTAHSYHTKVPHKAIMRYILHYTKPGDVVFDGFCGTGMTGVAAQLCGSPDPDFKATVDSEWAAVHHAPPEWGVRKALLADLSPAATFIAYNYNTPVDVPGFEHAAQRIVAAVDGDCGRLYEIEQTNGGSSGRLEYAIWSDVLVCPSCGADVVFWDAAVDADLASARDGAVCPACGMRIPRSEASLAFETVHDPYLDENVRRKRQVARVIKAERGSRYEVEGTYDPPAPVTSRWVPTTRMPEGGEGRRKS